MCIEYLKRLSTLKFDYFFYTPCSALNLFAQRTVFRASCYTGSFATSVNYEYDFTISLWLEFGSGFIIGTSPSSSKCCPCRIHPTRSGNKYTRSGDTVTYCQYFSKFFHSTSTCQQTFGPKLIDLLDSLLRRLCSAPSGSTF